VIIGGFAGIVLAPIAQKTPCRTATSSMNKKKLGNLIIRASGTHPMRDGADGAFRNYALRRSTSIDWGYVGPRTVEDSATGRGVFFKRRCRKK
jgi:hypothetical protein